MPFELPPSLVTGVDYLDEEHRQLIARLNEMEELERSGNKAQLLEALANFMADFADHYSAEGIHFHDLDYPKLESHAETYVWAVRAIDQLFSNIEKGLSSHPGVAHFCFNEVIATVLRVDKELASWLASKGQQSKH